MSRSIGVDGVKWSDVRQEGVEQINIMILYHSLHGVHIRDESNINTTCEVPK